MNPRSNAGTHWWTTVTLAAAIVALGPPAPATSAVTAAPRVGGMASDRAGHYWLLRSDGSVLAGPQTTPIVLGRGDAAPAVALAVTPDGRGAWSTGRDGSVVPAGSATFLGSTAAIHLNQPVVSIAASPDGNGYWLTAADGGVFAFGTAAFHGSAASTHLNQPIVSIAPTPDGNGYWLTAADGGVFAFGTAAFHGSAASTHLNRPIIGFAATPDGDGYWLAAADGQVFAFGDAANAGGGSLVPVPVVAIAPSPASGYVLAEADGTVVAAPAATSPPATGPGSPSAPPSPRPYPSPNPAVEASIAANIFAKDNDERAARGLPPVRWDAALAARAATWSREDLPRTGADPPGQEANVIGRGGCPNSDPGPCFATANLPSDGDAHLGWMYSQGHRDNIVDPHVTTEGVGVYCGPSGLLYATELFAGTASSATQPATPLQPIVHDDNAGLTCTGETRADNGLDRPGSSA